MDDGVRSGGPSEIVVKNRNSSGCLVVRRKGDASAGGHGSSGSWKVYESKRDEKRRRPVLSDSGSSDELLSAPRRRVGSDTIAVCRDLSAFGKGVEHNGDGRFVNSNGLDGIDRKRAKLDVFEFDEYDSVDGERSQMTYYDERGVAFKGRRFSGPTQMGQTGNDREYEAGPSRHIVDKRRNEYVERMSNVNRGNRTGKSRFEVNKFTGHSDQAIRLQGKNGVLKVLVNKKKGVSEPPKKYKLRAGQHLKAPRMEESVKKKVLTPLFSEEEEIEKPISIVKSEKKTASLRKSYPARNTKSSHWDSENSDGSLKREPENVLAVQSLKRVSLEGEDTPIFASKSKDGKIKRGSGTEKQKLREKIRGMLVDAGWTIDYRPRRNRDYLDAVYINPLGTAYWSIIKAYDAFQKQLNGDVKEIKPTNDGSSLRLIADEDLCQLTRKTRKKIEKEMKRKQREGSDSERRSTIKKHDSDSMDSASHEEKLSSFIKQGGKSFKSRNLLDTVERAASGSNSQGRKSKKLGRCTLLVRGSKKGLNSETDGFVPYTGKRTILSWLIESGVVQLSQRIQYKNRRRTRVMLEGWVTREGIHCGCCSKILTVSKFELHAGSKLRQPYQNIFLESGVSLLQCQIDAWNRQEAAHVGFHSVDTDGDDPNDDTCGICGDGGDLMCCDGCPSTFHQSCLDIEMLPPGDWHCPNCTCKYCGIATEIADEVDGTIPLPSCTLCEKKYHESCVKDISASSVDSSTVESPFCGQSCKELFECLQKNVGTKHDLEGGFSWSLTRRTDDDSKFTSNAKLAVAMTVMDECFLPIVDRRSGINLIRNALYSTGSNFNRLSYGGFYTAILEKGDEIISAASIRFHGTKLAEMPFIGTRHIYRRQGMCRRLFSAIESSLSSLKVEKLIIPAIAELTHTWTEVFGFIPIDESLKHEMKSMNMLVFPGIDMLQKLLGGQEHEAKDTTSQSSDSKQSECEEEEQCGKPEVADEPDTDRIYANETEEQVADEKTGLPIDNSVTGDLFDNPPKSKDPDLITEEKTDLLNVNLMTRELLDSPVESKDPDLIADKKKDLPIDYTMTEVLLDDPLESKDPDLIAEEKKDLLTGDLLDDPLESKDPDLITKEKTDIPDDMSVARDLFDDPFESKDLDMIAEEKTELPDDNSVTRDMLDDSLESKGLDLIDGTESSDLPSGSEISLPAMEGQNSLP